MERKFNVIFAMSPTTSSESRYQYQDEKKELWGLSGSKWPSEGMNNQSIGECFLLQQNGLLCTSIKFVLNVCDSVPTRKHSRKLQLIISVSLTGRAGPGDLEGYSLKFWGEFKFYTSLAFDTLQKRPNPYLFSTDPSLPSVHCHSPSRVFQVWITCFLFLKSFKFYWFS